MNKTKISLLVLLTTLISSFLIVTGSLFAQEETDSQQSQQVDPGAANADADALSANQVQYNLQEIAVRSFEDEGFWRAKFWRDNGWIQTRTQVSRGSQAKEPLPQVEGEEPDAAAISDNYILGTRIDFRRRAIGEAYILPARPIPVEGTVKTISLWVAGRNNTHVLKVIVRDRFDNRAELYLGELNFLGWKRLTATVPPGLKQRDFHFGHLGTGLLIEGFKIETTLQDSYGSFYVYFDDLRATTDLYGADSRDPDDPSDNW